MMRRRAMRKQYRMRAFQHRKLAEAKALAKKSAAEAAHIEQEARKQEHLRSAELVTELRNTFKPDQVDQSGRRYDSFALNTDEYIGQQFTDGDKFNWVKQSINQASGSSDTVNDPSTIGTTHSSEVIDLSDSEG